jgi:hypothetical protein
VPTRQFEVVHEILKDVDAPKRRLAQERFRWNEGRLGFVVAHVAPLQSARARRDILARRKLLHRPEIELVR